MMKLASLILTILLSVITSASDIDVPIYKGNPAIFDGVLVPDTHYRQYTEAMDLNDFYKQHPHIIETEKSDSREVFWFLSGIALGLVGGIVVSK